VGHGEGFLLTGIKNPVYNLCMGTPAILPVYSSLQCSYCFPIGKCPLHIYAVIHNVKKCPYMGQPPDPFPEAPNNILFKLTRNPSAYCYWATGDEGPWYVSYASSETVSGLVVYYGWWNGYECFGQSIGTKCNASFVNQARCDYPFVHWYDGTGSVLFCDAETAVTICQTMGFSPLTDTRFDKTPTIDNMADYRIANKKDKTNCLIRVDTSIIGG
jgi:hypothetical protein